MTITRDDIKWFQSERLTDNPDGGGRMTNNEVVDGQVNNLFSDISDLDRTIGRVSLRKAFAAVFTPNNDTYFGAGFVLVKPALDPAVNIVAFDTDDYFDERTAARDRLESYRVAGPETRWFLYSDHLTGSSVLRFWSHNETPNFDVGDVILLSIESDVFSPEQQYLRVAETISREIQVFVDTEGTFRRTVMTLEVDTPLQHDFPGIDVFRRSNVTRHTLVRSTSVQDAARYYGIKAVETDVVQGDLTIKVDNPYGNLVPATQAETPVSGEKAGLGRGVFAQAGPDNSLSLQDTVIVGATGASRFLGSPFLPGSADLTIAGVQYIDDGTGEVKQAGQPPIGTFLYEDGEVFLFAGGPDGTWNLTATPAAVTTPSPHTEQVPVIASNRALNYVRRLDPVPAPGTLTVDYRALNEWYRLFDRGDGTISGDAAGQGSGTVDYATGDTVVTLGALPDPDTAIIYTWSTDIDVSRRDGDVEIDKPEVVHTLSQRGAVPNTVTVSWTSGGSPFSLTDDGDGNLVDGSLNVKGRIIYATGETAFTPDNLPDPGTNIIYDYDRGVTLQENYSPTPDGSGVITFTLANAPVRPKSVSLEWLGEFTDAEFYMTRKALVADDGAGGFYYALPGPTGFSVGDTVVGASINYTTGEVIMPTSIAHDAPNPSFATRTCLPRFTTFSGRPWNQAYISNWTYTERTFQFASGGTVTAFYKENSVTDTTEQDTLVSPPVTLDLTPTIAEPLAPGSVRFTFNGRTYLDRGGSLVYGLDITNNAATVGGTVDYATGRCIIDDYQAGTNTVSILAAASIFGAQPVSLMVFRTPGAPVRQSSFSVSALSYEESAQLSASADINGFLSATDIEGHIDITSGLVEVAFGQEVVAAGNEAEWWYNPDAIDPSGNIWKPRPVFPGSVEFSVVVFKFIPIPADILGVDPVRLPRDGRVPMFRVGDVAVIHRSTTTSDASPSAGGTHDLTLANVRWLRVRDANGAEIPDNKYTLDDVNGIITWANPLDLAPFTLPITFEAMAYFQRLVSDVTVNGEIGINQQAPYALTADGSTFVSSKFIFTPQDMSARYLHLFGQETWTGVWSDVLIGDPTVGQYDDLNFPIIVLNNGAETERWRLEFTNSNTVNVIGEHVGQVLSGVSITTTIAPVNPATGNPYFSIDPGGWGGGWATGNNVRFNTISATHPAWFARTVLAGEPGDVPDDEFVAQIQGNAD